MRRVATFIIVWFTFPAITSAAVYFLLSGSRDIDPGWWASLWLLVVLLIFVFYYVLEQTPVTHWPTPPSRAGDAGIRRNNGLGKLLRILEYAYHGKDKAPGHLQAELRDLLRAKGAPQPGGEAADPWAPFHTKISPQLWQYVTADPPLSAPPRTELVRMLKEIDEL